ncbi:hypothetical protein CKA34_25000 (plasmid) [Rhizobium sp. 11515TR]|nr:hypothetical protein CKA34_25000 [Rhizobium sp. 11515TR]
MRSGPFGDDDPRGGDIDRAMGTVAAFQRAGAALKLFRMEDQSRLPPRDTRLIETDSCAISQGEAL